MEYHTQAKIRPNVLFTLQEISLMTKPANFNSADTYFYKHCNHKL